MIPLVAARSALLNLARCRVSSICVFQNRSYASEADPEDYGYCEFSFFLKKLI